MTEPWESWWYQGDATDRATNQRIAEVEAENSRARNRLAHQMAQQQGNLQGQIDRLTEALVAIVEHEDTRGELTEHADAAATRKYAREIVPNLVVTGGTGLDAIVAPPEVRDYWLTWAIRSVVATASGADGSVDLARALRLDPQRASLLVVLIDTIRRERRFSDPDLRALGLVLPTTETITRAERGLWLAITSGALGTPALALLEEQLRAALGTPDPAVAEAWARGLLMTSYETSAPIQAGRTLTALLETLDPPPRTYTVEAGDEELDRSGERPSEDPLAELVRSLVDEGAPGESEILDRMAQVRTRMGFVEKRNDQPRWTAPVGTAHELLLSDLRDASTPAGTRELALRLLGPTLAPVVAVLQLEAAATPPTTPVRLLGADLEVGPDGPDDSTWRTSVGKASLAATVVAPGWRPGGYAALGVGAVCLLLGFVNSGWLFLGVIALVIGAGCLVKDRILRSTAAAEQERRLRRAEENVVKATTKQVELRDVQSSELASSTAAAHRLSELLTGPATAGKGMLLTPPASAPEQPAGRE